MNLSVRAKKIAALQRLERYFAGPQSCTGLFARDPTHPDCARRRSQLTTCQDQPL